MDTAGAVLLQRALKLEPDFSEWRDKPRPGDEDFGPAPEIAGRYLAEKRRLLQKKKTGEIPAERQLRNIIEMNLLVGLAEIEFLDHVSDMEIRKRLRMRSSGRIVLVRNENDK